MTKLHHKTNTVKQPIRPNRFFASILRILIVMSACQPRALSQSQSMLEGATCLSMRDYHSILTAERLIDSKGFFKQTHTAFREVKTDLTYRMSSSHTIRTVFVMNREDCCQERIRQSAVFVGTESSNLLN